MKKLLFLMSAVMSALLILPIVLSALFTFLLSGRLPLVNITLSPSCIFVICTIIAAAIVGHLIVSLFEHFMNRPSTRSTHKAALPAKRYHRLYS